jgi:hypothetical protein
MHDEGHGRGEDSGEATSKNSSAYGGRNVEKEDDGTREISYSQKAHTFLKPSV